MKLGLLWRFGYDAIDELRKSKLRPTSVYLVFVLAWAIALALPIVSLLTGQSMQVIWIGFWHDLVFQGESPVLWYLLADFLLDVLILILVAFLPMLTILVRNECWHSARLFARCFVLFGMPVVFLCHLLMFLFTPTAWVRTFSSAPTSLWKQAVETSMLAQYVGLVAMSYGLLSALKSSQRGKA